MWLTIDQIGYIYYIQYVYLLGGTLRVVSSLGS